MHFTQGIRVVSVTIGITEQKQVKNVKTKRLALLGLLLMASVSTAFVVQAAGLMEGLRSIDTTEIKINTASVSLILTAEDRQKVMNIVLQYSQIQQLLASADNYTIEVSEIFDIN